MEVDRIIVQRLEKELYDQTIYDTFNKTTVKKYVLDNFKIDSSDKKYLEITIDS